MQTKNYLGNHILIARTIFYYFYSLKCRLFELVNEKQTYCETKMLPSEFSLGIDEVKGINVTVDMKCLSVL